MFFPFGSNPRREGRLGTRPRYHDGRPDGALDAAPTPPEKKPDTPTPLRKRIAAGLAALFVLALSIYYIYSIFTGGIFQW